MDFGVCWFPEQYPGTDWAADTGLMADIGLDHVRLGEFAWSSYQPARDRFDWQWLDTALETASTAGLSAILCTPTATPPIWLMRERPDIVAIGPDGNRRHYGSRRHTCSTSPAYREESGLITQTLAARYGIQPVLAGWQVDNEPGNHDSARCWCDQCQAAFTSWLQDRYGDIEALNEAWGTAFWSQTYPDFEAVLLPRSTMTSHNPSLELAHRTFASQQVVDFLKIQFDILGDRLPVTTNFYSEDTPVDQQAVARLGGVASMDNYPHGPSDSTVTSYLLDLTRGAAGPGGEAWVMEQQPGPINWTATNPPVPPGQVRTWTWQAALHGYDKLLFFRWRAARHAQEMYHSGLLRQDGTPTAAVDEIRQTITEIKSASLPAPSPRVALMHSYADGWALEISPHRAGLRQRDLQLGAYGAARRLGLDVAVVSEAEDLTDFDLVLAPAWHVTSDRRIAQLNAAIDAGTRIILGPRSLVINQDYAWAAEAIPAGMADRLGSRVIEHLSQTEDVSVGPWATPAGIWTDVLEETEEAEVVARYMGGTYLDGQPAAVQNGNLMYVGFSDVESWTELLGQLLDLPIHAPEVEVFSRGDVTYTIDHIELSVTSH